MIMILIFHLGVTISDEIGSAERDVTVADVEVSQSMFNQNIDLTEQIIMFCHALQD